jgi:hypothetical protein
VSLATQDLRGQRGNHALPTGGRPIRDRDLKWLRDPMRDDRTPDPWSNDDPELNDIGSWRTLLSIQYDAIPTGDGGAMHVLMPVPDLRRLSSDRPVLDVTSG